ncbi:MAG: flagellar FlbD family protein [Elusimicrobia bacterium]|nr:flagellar FlbD family protein [Elusimicrobiota bacterium]
MIYLHKLDGQETVVNAELIETLEPGPQTCVHLATGNKFLVRETADEVVAKVLEYRRAVAAAGKPVNPTAGYERGR